MFRSFLGSQSKITEMINEFFKHSFIEIAQSGFNMGSLKELAKLSRNESLANLEDQIVNLKMFEKEVSHKEDFNCMTSL